LAEETDNEAILCYIWVGVAENDQQKWSHKESAVDYEQSHEEAFGFHELEVNELLDSILQVERNIIFLNH